MRTGEAERRQLYETFAKNFWPPAEVCQYPWPQLVRVFLWRECERRGQPITLEEARALLAEREARDGRAG